MRSAIKTVALVIFSVLGAACSGTPRTASPATGIVAQSQRAPQTLVAANSAPATSSGAASAAAPTGEVDTSLVKEGYSVMRRHGEVYYCRNEIITGQRIGTRICLTAGQIQDEKQNVTKARDMLAQPSYECMGASCKN